MKQKWGRLDDAGDFPSEKAVWTIGAFGIALLSLFAIAGYRYMRVWTPLQRYYLPAYIGTQVAGAIRTDSGYTLLMVVTRKGTRLALDSEVEPLVTEKGDGTFTLTEEAIEVGDLKLEWQRGRYNNAKLHEFLGHWIYQDQTPADLAKPACSRQRHHLRFLGQGVEVSPNALPTRVGTARNSYGLGRANTRIRRTVMAFIPALVVGRVAGHAPISAALLKPERRGACGTGISTDTSPRNGCRIATEVAIGELAENPAACDKGTLD